MGNEHTEVLTEMTTALDDFDEKAKEVRLLLFKLRAAQKTLTVDDSLLHVAECFEEAAVCMSELVHHLEEADRTLNGEELTPPTGTVIPAGFQKGRR